MDLTRTLTVKIDPSGAVSGGNAAAGAFKSVGTSAAAMDQNLKSANKSLTEMGGAGGGGGGAMGSVANAARSMRGAFAALSGAVAAMGLAMFARDLVQTQVQMDRIGNSLRFATGGAQEGAEAFDWIRRVSKALGLDLASTGTAFSQFAAATKGTKIDFEETQRIFLAVSKASTVMGLSSDQAAGALNALQQMVSKGTVQAEELRGQLGERIPGAFNMAARAMGVTTQQLGKMLDNGQVLAADLLPKLAAEMEKTFGQEAVASAGGLNQEMNRLSTAWTEFKETVMKSGILEYVIAMINGLKEAVDILKRFVSAYSATNAQGQWGTGVLGKINQFNPFVIAARLGQTFAGPASILNAPAAPSMTRAQEIAALAPAKGDSITTMEAFGTGRASGADNFRSGFGSYGMELNEKTGKWFRNSAKEWVNAGLEAAKSLENGFQGFFESMIDGTKSVTESFKAMAKSILSDIASIVLRQAIVTPIVGAITGSLGIAPVASTAAVPKSHTGSLVGIFGGTSTNVDPSIFRGAPRFHSGLMPDEFPAILQKGEAVIPKSQVGNLGGGGVNVSVTVNMESSGNADEDGNKVGAEVARQVENMVRSILVRERRPRGMLA